MAGSSPKRYEYLAHELRSEIVRRRLQPGARLPSETELTQRHGVSRGTAVKTIEQLARDGLVVRRQGLGTFVAGAALRREVGALASFTEAVRLQGKHAGQRLLAIEPAPVEAARALGMTEPATRLTRLRLVDGEPSAIHVSLVPNGILDRFSPEHRASLEDPAGSAFSLYAAFGALGFEAERAEEHVLSRLARADELARLARPGPAAVMVVLRRTFDARGRLIEVSEAVYLSDGYGFDLELTRRHGGAMPHSLTPGSNPGLSPRQEDLP